MQQALLAPDTAHCALWVHVPLLTASKAPGSCCAQDQEQDRRAGHRAHPLSTQLLSGSVTPNAGKCFLSWR